MDNAPWVEVATGIAAAVSAVVGYLNRRQLKPKKGKRKIGEDVEGIKGDVHAMKTTIDTMSVGFLEHVRTPAEDAHNGGPTQ